MNIKVLRIKKLINFNLTEPNKYFEDGANTNK